MDLLNNIFKKLSSETMQPSDKVWKAIELNQQKKRNKMLWYFGTTVVAILLFIGGIYIYTNNSQNMDITPKVSENKSELNQEVVVDNSQVQNNNLTNTSTYNSSSYISNITNSVSNQNYSKVNNIPLVIDPKKNEPVENPIFSDKTYIKEEIERKNNTSAKGVTENSETEEQKKELKETKQLKDSLNSIEKNTDTKNIPLKIDTRKKKEHSKLNKYIQPSVFFARTYRVLGNNNDSFDYYKNLRNSSEISGNQLAFSLSYIVEYSKHFNMQYGIMYQSQKHSSNYTWQQVKTVLVLDSTQTKNVYDTATSTWITKTDSFTHYDKKTVPVIANGDVKFSYIKIPVIANYEFTRKKTTYYIGSGLALNILTTSFGSLRNFDLQNEGDPIPVKNMTKNIFGLDVMARLGARFQLKDRMAFQIGISTGYSLTNVFTKNYPLIQHNYWYGIESGFRWLLK